MTLDLIHNGQIDSNDYELWLKEYGYTELTANLFNNVLLKNGYLSADVGAGPKHEKWAHMIQLFLIEKQEKRSFKTSYTNHLPIYTSNLSNQRPV